MSGQKNDLLVSMRMPILLAFTFVWNAPVLYYLFQTTFNPTAPIFWRIVAVQVGWLVLACLLLSASAKVHRFVFRPGVPYFCFRRRLLIGAGFYALIGLVAWVMSLMPE